jgi:hypothetical protein
MPGQVAAVDRTVERLTANGFEVDASSRRSKAADAGLQLLDHAWAPFTSVFASSWLLMNCRP